VNGKRWMASDEAQADWLGGAHAEEAVTGFDATGWEASTGIAHAIHELPGVSVKSCGSGAEELSHGGCTKVCIFGFWTDYTYEYGYRNPRSCSFRDVYL